MSDFSFLRDDLPVASPMPLSDIKYIAKLDQNESPFDVPYEVKEKLLEEFKRIEWNRYPQPTYYQETREIFARTIGLNPENIAFTIGADQGIWMVFFLAGGKGRKAVIYEPTYPIFKHAARLTQTEAERITLGVNYVIDPDTFREKDIITIVNPNNPTGNVQEEEVIRRALETGKFVALDEAYYPFSGITYAHLVGEFPNLFIIRSLSKSLLAGVRIGYVIAHPEVIKMVDEILTAPYHMNMFQLVILRHFHLLKPHMEESAKHVNAEKERLYRVFENLGVKYYPSHANFILFRVEDADRIYNGLLERGVRIRNTSRMPGLENHLRVTIGKKEENDAFIEALTAVLS